MKLVAANLALLRCCPLCGQAYAQGLIPQKIFVEPFSGKHSLAQLRTGVVAQLRKLPNISVVTNRSEAEAFLSGDGEIWVKGYRSLNPRSGHLPADGMPIYSGYLSLELKDAKGDTLWSYLVVPPAGSTNISRDLSREVARHFSEAIAKGGKASPRFSKPMTGKTD